ncbi:LCP family protein [Bacillus alkalicellulosilyticus]|uniref:LCP family protein n=1 Tax=Alkalihalobacterium alkalicellulosilyticum TaxID=1912214 RepID=UPI0014828DE9|nr:LCP family protein [Bacillus alkalicellulosilyticus]
MGSRIYRKNKRRKRIMWSFIGIISVFLISFVTYSANQYQYGLSQSLQGKPPGTNVEKEEIEFNADEPLNDEIINILFVGTDERNGEKSRTDTIMIGQYDPTNSTAKIASIMRDCFVEIPGYQSNKINTSFFLGGPELLRQTIKDNFDIDIHYYAMVNFEGFVNVVDTIAPDGITVNIDHPMKYRDEINFQSGIQTLHGEDSLKYVRFRNDHLNDFGRVQRQQEVLTILKDKLLSVKGMTRIPQLVGAIEPHVDTNLPSSKMVSLTLDFVFHPVNEIDTLTIPVEDGFVDKRYPRVGQVLELDLEKNKEALHHFFSIKS